MTSRDTELQHWMDDWQATELPSTPPDRIRDYVRRRSRLLVLWIGTEAVIGVVGLSVVLYLIVAESDRIHQLLMVMLALIVGAVLAFEVWNWRGTLRPSAQDTATFVVLSMERLQRMRRAIRASWLLMGAQMAVFTPWVAYRLYGRQPTPTIGQQVFSWGLLLGLVAAAAVWTHLASRWVNRDASILEGLAREIED